MGKRLLGKIARHLPAAGFLAAAALCGLAWISIPARAQTPTNPPPEPADTICAGYTVWSQISADTRKHKSATDTALQAEASESAGQYGSITAQTSSSGQSACAVMAGDTSEIEFNVTAPVSGSGFLYTAAVHASSTHASAKAVVTGGEVSWTDPASNTGARTYTVVKATVGSSATNATAEARYARASKSSSIDVVGAKASQQSGSLRVVVTGLDAENLGSGASVAELANGSFQFGCASNVANATGTNADSTCHGAYGSVLETGASNGEARAIIKNSDVTHNTSGFGAPSTAPATISATSSGSSRGSGISVRIDEGLTSGGSAITAYMADARIIHASASANTSSSQSHLNPVEITVGSAASGSANTVLETRGSGSEVIYARRQSSNSKSADITITTQSAELKAAGLNSSVIYAESTVSSSSRGKAVIRVRKGTLISASRQSGQSSYSMFVKNMPADVVIGETGSGRTGDVTVTGNMSFTGHDDTIVINGGVDASSPAKGVSVTGDIDMKGGRNSLTVGGALSGNVSGESGVDTVTVSSGGAISGGLSLGEGGNVVKGAGSITGLVSLGGGNDIIGGAAGSSTDSALALASVNLGGGTNVMRAASASGAITGGSGPDSITLTGNAGGSISLGSGATNNSLTVGGTLGGSVTSSATGTDTVSIVGGPGSVSLGDGANVMTVTGNWTGNYGACSTSNSVTTCVDGAGRDSITFASGATRSQALSLTRGSNAVMGSGTIGNLTFGDGDDSVGGGAGETALNGLALAGLSLGNGENTVRAASATGAITGGSGPDTIELSGNAGGSIDLGGGATSNTLKVGGTISGSVTSSATGTDTVSIGGGSGSVSLGNGVNKLSVTGNWSGNYGSCSASCVDGTGSDTITFASGTTRTQSLSLTRGSNAVMGSGSIGDLTFGAGDDTVGGAEGETALNGLAIGALSLGNGENTVRAASASGAITGGTGIDMVYLSGAAGGAVNLGGGAKNAFEAGGAVPGDITSAATGVLTNRDVFVVGAVSGSINLGGGDNDLTVKGAVTGTYTGGSGVDRVTIDSGGSIAGVISPGGGANVITGSSANDTISIGAGDGSIDLGDGTNMLTVTGAWRGSYIDGSGTDTIIVNSGASVGGSVTLTGGANVIRGAGAVSGTITFGSGNATIGGSAQATTDNSLALGSVVLGGGTNTARAASASGTIQGGSGQDTIILSGDLEGGAFLGSGTTSNTLSVGGILSGDVSSSATGTDTVTLASGTGNVNLGNGTNALTVTGTWRGVYTEGSGADNITVASGGTMTKGLTLASGANTLRGSGTVSGDVTMGAGNDTIGNFASGAPASDNGLSLGAINLGNGANSVKAASTKGITGGSGVDIVEMSGAIDGDVDLKGGARNSLSAGGTVGGDITSSAAGTGSNADTVTVAAVTGDINLGGGENRLTASGAIAGGYTGGSGADIITLNSGGSISGTISPGSGANVITGSSGTDTVKIGAGSGSVNLLGGTNTLTISGAWTGTYTEGAGSDTVILESGGSIANLTLQTGASAVRGSGEISGTLTFGGGNDTVGGAAGETASNGLALGAVNLGGGNNTVRAASATGAISGGGGIDTVVITGNVGGRIDLGGGAYNTLDIAGSAGGRILSSAAGTGANSDVFLVGDVEDYVDLGNGENQLTVRGAVKGGYAGGTGSDTITLSPGGSISGLIHLLSGTNLITGSASDDAIILAGGSGTVNLGGGSNTATFTGPWGGEYQDGGGSDTLVFQTGSNISEDVTLSSGDNVVKGNTTIERPVTFGAGDDEIGDGSHGLSPAELEAANSLSFTMAVDLGSGSNAMRAVDAADITGGPGATDIILSGNATGTIETHVDAGLRGGVSVAGTLSGSIEVIGAGVVHVTINDGDGDVTAGGTRNHMTVKGDWTGQYRPGPGSITTITVTETGRISTRPFFSITSGATVKGSGKIPADLIFDRHNDVIGGDSDLATEDNGLEIGAVDLRDGNNTVRAKSASGKILGGIGVDLIFLSGDAGGGVDLGAGSNNRLEVGGTVTGDIDSVATGTGAFKDIVVVNHVTGDIDLGGGDNDLTISGIVSGGYEGGSGNDRIFLNEGASVTGAIETGTGQNSITGSPGQDSVRLGDGSGDLDLGNGPNTVIVGGSWSGTYEGGSGEDNILIESGATFAGSMSLVVDSNILRGAGTVDGTITFGAGDDRIGGYHDSVIDNSLTLKNAVLGDGINIVRVKTLTGKITGGDGPDTIIVSGNVDASCGPVAPGDDPCFGIDLGGGDTSNVLTVEGELNEGVTSSTTGINEININRGTGDLELGSEFINPENRITVSGDWSGDFRLSTHKNVLTIAEGVVYERDFIVRSLPDAGENIIKGSGVIIGDINTGIEDDRIGGVSDAALGDNGLIIMGSILLSQGNNTIRARSVQKAAQPRNPNTNGDVQVGNDDDIVKIAEDVEGKIFMQDGKNFLEVRGSVGGNVSSVGAGTGVNGDTFILHDVDGYVWMGGGDNSLTLDGAVTGYYQGGAGIDHIVLKQGGQLLGDIDVASGANVIEGSHADDAITLKAGEGRVDLGDGANTMTLTGAWTGTYADGADSDTVVIEEGASMSQPLTLTSGANTVRGAGVMTADIEFGDGNDAVGGAAGSAQDNSLTLEAVTLGEGDNALRAKAVSGAITAGSGKDIIEISGDAGGRIDLGGGDSDNTLVIGGSLGDEVRSLSIGRDEVTVARGTGAVNLGAGFNSLTITGDWSGNYSDGADEDVVTFGPGSLTRTERLGFTRGSNTVRGSAILSGGIEFGEGDDTVGDFAEDAPDNHNQLILGPVSLGNGENRMRAKSSAAITGGTGADTVHISGSVTGSVDLKGGERNSLVVDGSVSGDVMSSASGTGHDRDIFAVGGVTGRIDLGGGDNHLTVSGTVTGGYTGGSGIDTIHLLAGGSILDTINVGSGANLILGSDADDRISLGAGAGSINLGNGNNTLTLTGAWTGEYTEGEGADTIIISEGASISASLVLKKGENKVIGSGEAFEKIEFGDGNDTIGGDAADEVDNSLELDGLVLGGGTNVVRAKSSDGDITGGSGDDTIILSESMHGDALLGGGDGDNSLWTGKDMAGKMESLGTGRGELTIMGSWTAGSYQGGVGPDTITVAGDAATEIYFGAGAGDNTFTLAGELTGSVRSEGTGTDLVTIGGGSGTVNLGNGSNTLRITGPWTGSYTEGSGRDVIILESGVTRTAVQHLTSGSNAVMGSGAQVGALVFGEGDDTVGNFGASAPPSDNRLVLGQVDLGNGDNRVMAIISSRLTGGDGPDEVRLAQGANGGIDLRGGRKNILESGGTIGGNVSSSASGTGADKDMYTVVAVNGNVSLGDGDNDFTVSGPVTGTYTGGSGIDTIILESGGSIGGAIATGAGEDSITGSAASDTVILGQGGGTIGLGEGNNSLTVQGAWSGAYSSGGGNDLIFVNSEGAFSPASLDPGAGTNKLFIEGVAEGPDGTSALSLSQALGPDDSLFLCNGAANRALDGCGAPSGNDFAFKALLDARTGGAQTWELLRLHNHESAAQSQLTVKGRVEFENPEFNNFRLLMDGEPVDHVGSMGEYGITDLTLFELDLNTEEHKADFLQFNSGKAMAGPDFRRVAPIDLKAKPSNVKQPENTRIDFARTVTSDISGVSVRGTYNGNQLVINNQVWLLERDRTVQDQTTYYIKATNLEVPKFPGQPSIVPGSVVKTTDHLSEVVENVAASVKRLGRDVIQFRGRAGMDNLSALFSPNVHPHVILTERRVTFAEQPASDYGTTAATVGAAVNLNSYDHRRGKSTHYIIMNADRSESKYLNEVVESSSAGLGYGYKFHSIANAHASFSAVISRNSVTVETKSGARVQDPVDMTGLTSILEVGKGLYGGIDSSVHPVIRLVYSEFGKAPLKDGSVIDEITKFSGEMGILMDFRGDYSDPWGSAGVWNIYGSMSVSRDFTAEYQFTELDKLTVTRGMRKTWAHLDLGWSSSIDVGSRAFVELSVSVADDDAGGIQPGDGEGLIESTEVKNRIIIGYDANW